MLTETRLTVRLDGAALERLRTHPVVRQLRQQRTINRRVRAVYYDTAERRLQKQSLSLALSHVVVGRDDAVEPMPVGAALHMVLRQDTDTPWVGRVWRWDIPAATEMPPALNALPAAIDAPLPVLRDGLPPGLQPIFVEDVQRANCLIGDAAWEAEFIVDQGRLIAHDRTETLAEASFILRRGDPSNLFQLTAQLGLSLPIRVSGLTVADRGHALVTGQAPQSRKAPPVPLAADATVAEAFRAIARSCIGQILVNQECLTATGAPESIHQMRVGLRRLRSAVSVFRPLIASPETDGVKEELRRLQETLGPARDADVFVSEILMPARTIFADDREFQALAEVFRARHRAAHEVARAAVTDFGFARLLMRFALWADGEGWLEAVRQFGPADPDEPARAFAANILERRHRRMSRAMQNLATIDDAARHRARIETKKFRYALEFFASLFDVKKVQRVAGVAAQLQEALGNLNDIAVARATLQAEAVKSGDPAFLWSAGLIAGWHAARKTGAMQNAQKSWDVLRKLPRFWGK